MPNPFPGVDPFIEAAHLWPGFHTLLVGDCSRLLNRILKPRGYAAFVDERVEPVDLPEENEDRRPDVAVTRPKWNAGTPVQSQVGKTAVIDIEPAVLMIPPYELLTVAYIDIRYLPGQQLVTSIELLSPTNKGSSRGGYAAKRQSVLATKASLVEIDLLLEGRRPEVVGRIPPGDFCVLVSRGDRRPECEAFAWSIRRGLPRIPIPLRPGDDDAILDLSAAYSMTYEDGPYDLAEVHQRELPENLAAADRVWAMERVAASRVSG